MDFNDFLAANFITEEDYKNFNCDQKAMWWKIFLESRAQRAPVPSDNPVISVFEPVISVLVEKFDELKTEIRVVAEQTKPQKIRKKEQASHLHSDVRDYFFQCKRVPLISELPRFLRFDPPGDKANVLLDEVVRYVDIMRTRYLAGQVTELVYVQPEIRDHFWPNTRSCLRNQQQLTMNKEKKYIFAVDNEDMEAIITGKTDHVIQPLDSDFASATIEDKANCSKLSLQEVTQVVTQVDFEVGQMERFLNYAPVEYVGLLQNGPVWIAVLRKIDKGKVLWTYIQTSPAFVVNEESASELTATAINMSSCIEIARLIEHAYCTADKITEEIMYPERRPTNVLYTINEYQHQCDDDEDEEDQDASKGNSKDFVVPGKLGGAAAAAAAAPAKQSTRQEQQKSKNAKPGSKKSRSDSNTAGSSSSSQSQEYEYFVLPLSIANVSRHAATVC